MEISIISDYAKEQGYDLIDDSYYNHIRYWKEWYRGEVKDFHQYTVSTGKEKIKRQRHRMNMAKQGCETWASLLWNYECTINVAEKDQRKFNEVLKYNNFNDNFIELIEEGIFATGTGGVLVYPDGESIRIDFIDAEYIYPISWSNKRVTSCIFAGEFVQDNKKLIYLMIHEELPDKTYKISNKYFESGLYGSNIKEVPPPDGVKAEYFCKYKMFGIGRPNLANNIAKLPLGISVYANAIHNLKGIDLAYDGVNVSMETGKPRLGVTQKMLDISITDDGGAEIITSRFDPNDVVIYNLGESEENESVGVKDMTPEYRAAGYEKSLQTQLDLYSQVLGLGERAFKLDPINMSTATQVISSDQRMLRNMEKHQETLRPMIRDMAVAILSLIGGDTKHDIEIIFDDSATRNKEEERKRFYEYVKAGDFPLVEYYVRFEGFTEEEARQLVEGARKANTRLFPEEE